MNVWTRTWVGAALSLLLVGSAQAALESRLGGQAVYDTDLDITWLADANLAASNSFGIDASGHLSEAVQGGLSWYGAAVLWIDALNEVNYLGYSDWRLPTGICGSEGSCIDSELGHLFYDELGGSPGQDIGVAHNENYFLFSNLTTDPDVIGLMNLFYWTSSEGELGLAWGFDFSTGDHYWEDGETWGFAWAVRDGNVIPVPGAVWLLGSALGLLGIVRRRNQTSA